MITNLFLYLLLIHFFKNDTIVEKLNSDLDVQEGERKILFSNIKSGHIPLSTITIVDNSNKEIKETRVEDDTN